jgi:hypothetical protein
MWIHRRSVQTTWYYHALRLVGSGDCFPSQTKFQRESAPHKVLGDHRLLIGVQPTGAGIALGRRSRIALPTPAVPILSRW